MLKISVICTILGYTCVEQYNSVKIMYLFRICYFCSRYVREEVLSEVFEEFKCKSNDRIIQPMSNIKQNESINMKNVYEQLSK